MDLQKITTEKPPTSFIDTVKEEQTQSIENTLKNIKQVLGFDLQLNETFDQAVFSERNKVSHVTKIICDMLILVLDQDDTSIQNPTEMLIHKQNKKFIKESLIFLINNLKNYRLDDKKLKTYLTGKLIQSLHESK